jgi:hypothetical protein
MVRIFRRSFIIALALAFIASGAGWQRCIAANILPAQAPNHSGLQSHSAHAAAHHHAHDGIAHHHTGNNSDQQPISDHACVKCCSLCTIGGVILLRADRPVAFTVSAISFFASNKSFSDRTILVDPGIPKSFV